MDDIAGEENLVIKSRKARVIEGTDKNAALGGCILPKSHGDTMRKVIVPILILAGTFCVTNDANAQRRHTHNIEQAARSGWSPTRSATAQAPARHHSQNPVHQAGHEIPVPIAQTITHGPIVNSIPMDGQIIHSPIHDGGCDSIACGPGCGCDSAPSSCGSAACGASCGCDVSGGGCDGIGNCSIKGCSMCGELASPNAWRPCLTIGLPQDGWVSYDYLTWWQDGMNLPPLVTSSPIGTARGNAGVLGIPGTSTLFGGGDVLEDEFDGGRLRFGFWLDRCHTWGIAGEFFRLSDETDSFTGSSTGSPILARPFFNTSTGLNDSELVAFPGVLSGTVTAQANSELVGGGFHFKRLTCCQEGCKSWLFCGCKGHYCSRTERLIGYRYLQLTEGVRVTEDLVSTDNLNPGSFNIFDQFDTRNQFNGVDLGWKYRVTRGYWTYSALLRMAVGSTRQTVTIDGQTVIDEPGAASQTLPGGLLAQTSNIGTFKQSEFSVIPELDLELGYQLTDRIKLSAGYTFIYWSNVVRPGEQISLDLNPALLPPEADPFTGVQRPGFAFDTTDYWVQGLNFGLEYRW